MQNSPIKRTRTVSTSSYTWWEDLDEATKELTLTLIHTGGAYDGCFVIFLKISQEINAVVFSRHYIMKGFSCREAKEAQKKLEELIRKIDDEDRDVREAKRNGKTWKEKRLPTLLIEFPTNWDFLFMTSIPKDETKKSLTTSLYSKKDQDLES